MNTVRYEELTLTNDFIFSKAMRNPKLCKKLLEIILGVKIRRIEYVNYQEVMDIDKDAKSIRLDVYVEDDANTVYNIEMETSHKKDLPKRTRYYHGMIDLNMISKGAKYRELKESIVIFICMFDPFKQGRHLYTFKRTCEEDKDLLLKDDDVTIFLNPYGTMDDIDEELRNFLVFLLDETVSDDFTQDLQNEVEKVRNNKEWRAEYMTFYTKLQDTFDEAYDEGFEKGQSEGYEKGQSEGYEKGQSEGYEDGYGRGQESLIREKVKKKLSKGKSIEVIAEELEETPEKIQEICNAINE